MEEHLGILIPLPTLGANWTSYVSNYYKNVGWRIEETQNWGKSLGVGELVPKDENYLIVGGLNHSSFTCLAIKLLKCPTQIGWNQNSWNDNYWTQLSKLHTWISSINLAL